MSIFTWHFSQLLSWMMPPPLHDRSSSLTTEILKALAGGSKLSLVTALILVVRTRLAEFSSRVGGDGVSLPSDDTLIVTDRLKTILIKLSSTSGWYWSGRFLSFLAARLPLLLASALPRLCMLLMMVPRSGTSKGLCRGIYAKRLSKIEINVSTKGKTSTVNPRTLLNATDLGHIRPVENMPSFCRCTGPKPVSAQCRSTSTALF